MGCIYWVYDSIPGLLNTFYFFVAIFEGHSPTQVIHCLMCLRKFRQVAEPGTIPKNIPCFSSRCNCRKVFIEGKSKEVLLDSFLIYKSICYANA